MKFLQILRQNLILQLVWLQTNVLMKTIKVILCLLGISILSSCGDDNEMPQLTTPNFDRSEMVSFWADDIIIPSLTAYVDKVENLVSAKDDFIMNPESISLEHLRQSWLEAYISWQYVSIYDIGKAETVSFRNFVNIYPTDTEAILDNIASQSYNLELPSNFDAQGFPALDFLLYGLDEKDSETIKLLGAPTYNQYLNDLVNRIHLLSSSVLDDWQNGYRDAFVANDGASATASVDKLVNDFLYYYEKFLRAGKVGIPAGVFSGNALSHTVEAPYSGEYSKDLLNHGFTAARNFFNGVSSIDQQSGTSLSSFLKEFSDQNQTQDLSIAINTQWDIAQTKIDNLLPNLKDQVELENLQMLETYDELQKAVVLLKVDMLQAMDIKVDYVDADGD